MARERLVEYDKGNQGRLKPKCWFSATNMFWREISSLESGFVKLGAVKINRIHSLGNESISTGCLLKTGYLINL